MHKWTASLVTWLLGSLLLTPWIFPARPQSPASVSRDAPTLIINEIAWGGTQASSADEWIELYNRSALTVSVAGWTLYAQDGSPTLALTGDVAPGGFYLIERTDDQTVSDVPADLIIPFGTGLSNAGEILYLANATGEIVDTANAGGGPWPTDGEGGAPSYYAMERIAPTAPDEAGAWVSNDGQVAANGLDAGGEPINGTPKAANAAYIQTRHADLVAGQAGPATAAPGATVTYVLNLHNNGGLTATSTWATDTLAPGLIYLQASEAPTQLGKTTLTWRLGDLLPGESRRITLTTRISGTLAPGDKVTNALAAATTTPEYLYLNNQSVWTTTVMTDQEPANVLITGVLYDGYQLNDADEAVEVRNCGMSSVNLEGWELCKITDQELACRTLPDLPLAPHEKIWLTRDAGAFLRSFGFSADQTLAPWLGLTNTGDEVILRTPDAQIADALVYGDGALPSPGWVGPALQPYYNHLRGTEGQILSRIVDEDTGLPLDSTNAVSDWIQTTDNVTQGRRVRYPGWELDRFATPLKVTETATVIVGIAPDNAFDVLSQTLLAANHTISAELYALRHPDLIDILAAKARAGVDVKLLLEGNPVGVGIESAEWQTQLYACQTLEEAGGQCWFMAHAPDDAQYNRYTYLHSKLIIVDGAWACISSQNLTPGGLPSDDKHNGTWGSRGVLVVTNAPHVVRRAVEIVRRDLDQAHTDLVRWNTTDPERYGPYREELVDLIPVDGVSYTVAISRPLILSDTVGFELLTAPEAALRQSDGLLGLIAQAGKGDTLYVQQMYEQVAWGEDPVSDPNLRLQAYINAARRGAAVRILLNGYNFVEGWDDVPEDGQVTTGYVNRVAREEQLNLRAATANPCGEGIHNKMVLVDLHHRGRYAHIGSINGSETASKVNREVAIQMQSDAVYAYLADLFTMDWWRANPLYLPLIAREYAPLPPVTHPGISEILYAGPASGEWIEIYNPTPVTVMLETYKVGDAESPDVYEAMFQFPPGTVLAPNEVLVIAVNAAAVPEADLEFYESDPDVPNMVPYPKWGSLNYPLALRDAGDHSLLLGEHDQVVDIVVWGDKSYPEITAHPGVVVQGASLERMPPNRDTGDCSVDFRERYPPTPGEIPAPQGP